MILAVWWYIAREEDIAKWRQKEQQNFDSTSFVKNAAKLRVSKTVQSLSRNFQKSATLWFIMFYVQ